jgi:hypothetical protein
MSDDLPEAMNQTLTVIREGKSTTRDDYGNPVPGAESRTDIARCSIQPLLGAASVETVNSELDQVVTRWRFFTPPGADIAGADHVSCWAGEFAVDGDPVTWPGEDGSPHHIEGYLKKWEG